ncbi:hypothetical protein SCG7086_AF_00130 [Chlamydiales bacterium SCGC AG-110-P3]|nr:hypothetical protein SCG7086_AF_00130 [Chlamydiales bacterium SCGC AG-110-P3]
MAREFLSIGQNTCIRRVRSLGSNPAEICKPQEKNHHRAHRVHREILLVFLSVDSVVEKFRFIRQINAFGDKNAKDNIVFRGTQECFWSVKTHIPRVAREISCF